MTSSPRPKTRTLRRCMWRACVPSAGMPMWQRNCTKKSKEQNIQIVPADIPDLCVLDPNPVQTFIRRVMFAMTELEKNLIVQRLRHGQQRKKELAEAIVADAQANNNKLKIGQLTQEGEAKSCGSKSTLHSVGSLTTLQSTIAIQQSNQRSQFRKLWLAQAERKNV